MEFPFSENTQNAVSLGDEKFYGQRLDIAPLCRSRGDWVLIMGEAAGADEGGVVYRLRTAEGGGHKFL
jgi:hypothetical protein